MPMFRVPLEKEYQSRSGHTTVKVRGYIDVEAKDRVDAQEVFDSMNNGGALQTIDPRIVWDWEATGWSEADREKFDLEYVDWSFGMRHDGIIKPVGVSNAS